MSWDMLDMSALRRIELFDEVNDETLADVVSIAETQRYEAGDIIFDEGDSGDALHFILDGSVRICRDLHGAGQETLAVLESGAYFGEMALLEGDAVRSARATVDTDAHIGTLQRSNFLELLDAKPDATSEILWSFITMLCSRIRQTNDKVTLFALSSRYD